ncbi:MAG TPA: RES family NAD+ phosphorylase [Gammaproteobacteria bacterium]|nr:RES family NAD+ phosphorylase [Gammaproteobacteria bacterium]
MISAVPDGLTLSDLARRDWVRNIVSLPRSEDLYDDIADSAAESAVAVAAELAGKPPHYLSAEPVIQRPFEEADYFNAIRFPFEHWSESRYSTGRWGVWYGAATLFTSACETVHHWLQTIADAVDLPAAECVIGKRRAYDVRCEAALLDLRPAIPSQPLIVDPAKYAYTQSLGAQLVREKQPGLMTNSARGPDAVVAVFVPEILTNPRHKCYLTYRLDTRSGDIRIDCGADEARWQVRVTEAGRIGLAEPL